MNKDLPRYANQRNIQRNYEALHNEGVVNHTFTSDIIAEDILAKPKNITKEILDLKAKLVLDFVFQKR